MVDRGQGGCILNISTVSAMKPLAITAGYSMCKAAMDMLTKSMALELGKHKVCYTSSVFRSKYNNFLPYPETIL